MAENNAFAPPKFEELSMFPLNLRGVNKERVMFQVFNGTVRLSIFPEKNGNGVIFNEKLSPSVETLFKRELKTMLTAGPGTKAHVLYSPYDIDKKQNILKFGIQIVKDDKQVYNLEIRSKDMDTCKIVLRSTQDASSGTDPMSDAERSNIKLCEIIDWFEKYVPTMKILTKKKFKGSTYNKNTNNSGSSNSSSGDVDDIFS